MLAIDDITLKNMRPIQRNMTSRAPVEALRKVWDQMSIRVEISIPTPVIANTGMTSKSKVPCPRSAASAKPWIAAIELYSIEATSVAPTTHSIL